ncbi:hypothetical protein CNYM01_01167 [Colletotrichum nymphaeae SA-01]|uniref:Uncharacterized protein n=1 Tax=Colletotrichum nymphaeae SA-01 TaxID=1460502 RepID=A0A135TZC1_9PEZI|nr:hypothetical protein CNYM01_01167 [Colletotrichum nymphaeae SA-01]
MFFARSLFRSSATATSQPGSASPESMQTNGNPQFEVVDDDAGDDHESFRMDPSIESSQFRTNFYPSYTMVYGWPSTGGFYMLHCDGVDLEFLGLNRLVPTPRSDDSADEDAHCINMRKLGAKFYKSDWDYHLKTTTHENPQDRYQKAIRLGKDNLSAAEETYKVAEKFIEVFGWPTTGGVWALKLSTDKIHTFGIRNAFTMDEKCRAIEMMGGVFYADPNECPGLDFVQS